MMPVPLAVSVPAAVPKQMESLAKTGADGAGWKMTDVLEDAEHPYESVPMTVYVPPMLLLATSAVSSDAANAFGPVHERFKPALEVRLSVSYWHTGLLLVAESIGSA